jgi:hypothetical protein
VKNERNKIGDKKSRKPENKDEIKNKPQKR